MSPKKLERTVFAASRHAEYFEARQLSALTGTPISDFANVVLKELIDNSLDACETAGTVPEIDVTVHDEGITVSDNGPGIPTDVVRRLIDYEVRVSDKAAYRSPTRGAQGNALKTVIGIPYALGSRKPIVIVDGAGIEHQIRPHIDPGGHVQVGRSERNGYPEGGTTVEVHIPFTGEHPQDFHPEHWVRSFAAFNPPATIRYHW